MQYSQEFLLKETQRLKKDLDENNSKLNFANELRAIDRKTLNTFKTKFQDLTRLLNDVKNKEMNAWYIVQVRNFLKFEKTSCTRYRFFIFI